TAGGGSHGLKENRLRGCPGVAQAANACGEEVLESCEGTSVLGAEVFASASGIFGVPGRVALFVTDFYCASRKLVVEIDGGIHEKQKDYDLLRSEILEAKGLKVVRLSNREVFAGEEVVYRKLAEALGG
ncbi:MAG TPA: DUF559 domain-containing protein, partial [Bacteroidetes bacterium]|nr:DUF559 domain-containing protein [Bacteroidota bacterium]